MAFMLALVLAFGCPAPDGGFRSRPVEVPVHDGDASAVVMYGYSWVDGVLAVMPKPADSDLPAIAADGVDLLVTLTETPLSAEALAAAGLDGMHLPIVDYQAPTDDQMLAFVDAVEARRTNGQRVGVHCLAGRGRSGTMAAVWFVHEGMTADQAIADIRELRPGSIETDVQEEAVHRYADVLR